MPQRFEHSEAKKSNLCCAVHASGSQRRLAFFCKKLYRPNRPKSLSISARLYCLARRFREPEIFIQVTRYTVSSRCSAFRGVLKTRHRWDLIRPLPLLRIRSRHRDPHHPRERSSPQRRCSFPGRVAYFRPMSLFPTRFYGPHPSRQSCWR